MRVVGLELPHCWLSLAIPLTSGSALAPDESHLAQ